MAMPSPLSSARASSARNCIRRVSPASTKSVADSVVSGMFCATCASRHWDGIEKSPLSSCSEPSMRANKVDLPAPLRPTSAIFSPGLRVSETLSMMTLAPRRKVRFLRVIIEMVWRPCRLAGFSKLADGIR
jgi:hypothetical protein